MGLAEDKLTRKAYIRNEYNKELHGVITYSVVSGVYDIDVVDTPDALSHYNHIYDNIVDVRSPYISGVVENYQDVEYTLTSGEFNYFVFLMKDKIHGLHNKKRVKFRDIETQTTSSGVFAVDWD